LRGWTLDVVKTLAPLLAKYVKRRIRNSEHASEPLIPPPQRAINYPRTTQEPGTVDCISLVPPLLHDEIPFVNSSKEAGK
jgi:hypothetical protein